LDCQHHETESYLRSWQPLSCSRNSLPFMEYDISLSYTQEPVTGSYHHRAESSTYPHILFTWEPTEYEYYPPVYAYVFQMCFPFRL